MLSVLPVLTALTVGQLQISQVFPELSVDRYYSVAYDPTLGLYVVAGASGSVAVSADGFDFSRRLSGSDNTLRGAAASPDRLVIASDGGEILSSPDGDTWTEHVTGAGLLQDAEYLGALFVVVGRSGTIYTSPDGTTWTERISNTTEDLNSVSYNGMMYVAVGTNGVVVTSLNGVDWTEGNIAMGLDPMRGVAFGAGVWVAAGDMGQIYTSADAITWTEQTFAGGTAFISDVTFDGNRFAATTQDDIYTSTDGASWTLSFNGFANLDGITTTGAGEIYAVGDGGYIMRLRGPPNPSQVNILNSIPVELTAINYDGFSWFVVGVDGAMFTSATGARWFSRGSDTDQTLNDFVTGNGLRVAVGNNGTVTTSTNGSTWSAMQVTGFTARDFQSVTFHDGLFVLAGEAGVILTSPDGSAWTERTSGTVERLYAVRYLDDAFYAVGGASTITRSTNGTDWTAVTGPGDTILREIAFDGTQFVAAGSNPSLRSTNGVDWETITSGPVFRFCVAFGDGRWVQSGNNSTISESLDSVSWSIVNSAVQASYRGCRFADNRMAFVTTAGGVYFEALLRAVSNGPFSVDEAGGSDTYTLTLAAAPLADVTVALSTNGQVETDVNEVVFTPSNWADPRTITVNAVDDLFVEGDHSGSISHVVTSPDGRFDALPIDDIVAQVFDNDTIGVVVAFPDLENEVTEAGTTDTYTLVLTEVPSDPVTVTLTPNPQVSVMPTQVMFTDANFDMPVTITVSAVDDAIDDDGAAGTIVHTVESDDLDYDEVPVPDASFVVIDNDAAGIGTTPDTLALTEGATPGTYTLVLQSQPTNDVDIALTFSGPISVAPSPLTFTAGNWDSAQMVTVTSIDDAVASVPPAAAVMHAVTSADGNYDGLIVPDIAVTLINDDQVGIQVSFDGDIVAVTEGGASADLRVRLSSEPSADVTVTVAADTQLTASLNSLTFTAMNWNIQQTVTIAALDDTDAEGAHSGQVTLGVMSSDTAYNALADQTQAVAITDNDVETGTGNGNDNTNSPADGDDPGAGDDDDDGCGGCQSSPAPLNIAVMAGLLWRVRRRRPRAA